MTRAENQLPASWFGPPPELIPDEQWIASHLANRTQGKRAVGGSLHFTSHRVLFSPNVIDSKLGGASWSCSLANIVGLGLEPRRFSLLELFSGGLANRLRIETRAGRELFVVRRIPDQIAELRKLVENADPKQSVAIELPEARVVERQKR